MHLSPLLQESWSATLEDKDADNKSLEALAELVREEVRLRMPCHQIRMDLLKTKQGQEKHSDYLDKLGNLFSVAEFEQMTGDESQIHVLIESADPQMARIALELLEKENSTIQRPKFKVKEIKNSVWYNQKKEKLGLSWAITWFSAGLN